MNNKIIASILFFLVTSFFPLSEAVAEEKLVFAVDIIRHGDRTPAKEIPKSTHEWEEGLGQLTSEGMKQEYQNGIAFRKMYVDQYNLLPAKYKYNTIYVRSTDSERTLMSAASVLFGLYPLGTGPLPEGYQPVPIKSHPRNTDSLLVPDYDIKRRDILLEKYVYPSVAWVTKTAELKPKFKEWSDASGFEINNLHDVLYLGDNLRIRKIHNISLPESIDKDADDIIAAAEWAFVNSYKPEVVGAINSHELLGDIQKKLEQASKQETPLKYVLYSAHDSTLLCVLSALQAPSDQWPPYASDLKFMLFEEVPGNYAVKILYNNQPVNLPACGGTNTCSLTQFTGLVASIEETAKSVQLS